MGEALRKDSTCHSKLEKADILEMTVRYLRSIQQTRQFYNPASYRQGFGECREQVLKFLVNCPDLPASSKGKILTQVSTSLMDQTQQIQNSNASNILPIKTE